MNFTVILHIYLFELIFVLNFLLYINLFAPHKRNISKNNYSFLKHYYQLNILNQHFNSEKEKSLNLNSGRRKKKNQRFHELK